MKNKFYKTCEGVGNWVFLVGRACRACHRGPLASLILQQCFEIGVLSLPVVAITGFATGLVLAAQAYYQLMDKGLVGMTGLFVGKSMLMEVGPGLTAFMITGRVGSAMCALLGTMRITEQIDALRSMAVDPYRYLVVPRLVASMIVVPILTLFAAFLGIYGGYLLFVYIFHLSPASYFGPMTYQISYFDVWTGMIKGVIFGFFISTIACYKGLTVQGGAEGVGRSTTQSVVITYSIILIANFLLTMMLHKLSSS